MHGKNFVEMITLTQIDIGCLVFKPKTELLVNIDGDIIDIKSDGITMTTSKNLLEKKTNKPFNELFVSKEEVINTMTTGSQITLLTSKGVATYSVEGISFPNDGIAYATLHLKIV